MKPTLRIIHHLHRTGGTLISKCLASLPYTALLSEVNPGAPRHFMVFDPAFQASFWLRLLSEEAANQLRGASFTEKIKTIHLYAMNRGEALIIRNWAYLDFFARPFADAPTKKLATAIALENDFELRQVVTVRHPMDQWLSWRAYGGTAKAEYFTFQAFIDACLDFHDQTRNIPCIRYEDFVADPRQSMKELCAGLDLNYDPIFLERWPYYHQITGDDNDRSSGNWSISPRPKRIPDANLMAQASDNENYFRLLTHYDYLKSGR